MRVEPAPLCAGCSARAISPSPGAARSVPIADRAALCPAGQSVTGASVYRCVYCFARKTHSYPDLDTGHGFDSQTLRLPRMAKRGF
ncbi:hypothetical protein DDW44_26375 [Streptomyces tirandamycinicus]|uniref:Uncharacterized protein n=1 Tax=Streptomyces tirandamycinicus TaxID=2174846 RepID=A0A2S1SZT3_9ACTN|nr:hypothetical protein DDW44_26375 [Streptomyces tirandamycinicus]